QAFRRAGRARERQNDRLSENRRRGNGAIRIARPLSSPPSAEGHFAGIEMPVTIHMVDRVDEVPDRAEEYTSYLAPFGYRFVYHDGLNAFFVADEHRALEKAFTRPPGIFDKISHDASIRPYREELELMRDRMQRDQRRYWIVTGILAAL